MTSIEGNNSIIKYCFSVPNDLPIGQRTQAQAGLDGNNRGWSVPLDIVIKHLFPYISSRKDLARMSRVCYPYSRVLQPVTNLLMLINKIYKLTLAVPSFIWDFRDEAQKIYTLGPGRHGVLKAEADADQKLPFGTLRGTLAKSLQMQVRYCISDSSGESVFYNALVRTNHRGSFEAATQFALRNIASENDFIAADSLELLIDLVSAGYDGAYDVAIVAALQCLESQNSLKPAQGLRLFKALITAHHATAFSAATSAATERIGSEHVWIKREALSLIGSCRSTSC